MKLEGQNLRFLLDVNQQSYEASFWERSIFERVLGSLKAYLHGTTLSHATSLRQAYDMT